MPKHRFIAMELASSGFGSPAEIMDTRVDLIIDAYDYLVFKNKFEQQTFAMRSEQNGSR